MQVRPCQTGELVKAGLRPKRYCGVTELKPTIYPVRIQYIGVLLHGVFQNNIALLSLLGLQWLIREFREANAH